MGKQKNKHIPHSIFHKMWDEAAKYDLKTEYINAFVNVDSNKRIPFMNKYGISENKAYDLLSYVYDIRNMPFSDILKHAKVKKAQVSHELCIPIRTIEDWCADKSKCPGYTKLMILKHFGLFKLPQGISLGEEIKENSVRKNSEKPKEPEISEEILLRSTRHKTYIEIQRSIEEQKRQRRQENDPLSVYLRKHGKLRECI